ncbi:MAG TPA: sialate O-acetylesterase [Pelobium sp.]|nr:sialate O-acetylesterase [Pelobium sp.]
MTQNNRFFLFLVFFLVTSTGFAQIKLPQLIADSMVLQRDAPLKIWGWASPGEKVKVTFNSKKASAITDKYGKWSIILPVMKAGGPYQMKLQGKNTIILKGILMGDVWLCSGQSNMVHQMRLHAVRYADDIAKADYPEIRQFWVPTATNLNGPNKDLPKSSWKWANPEDVKEFSAVAYFFARNIYQQHHIPIGIINSSVGGTPIEAWTSEAGFKDFDNIRAIIKQNKDTAYVNSRSKEVAVINTNYGPDKGLSGDVKWFSPDYEAKQWQRITVPGFWEDQGVKGLDGVVWYRKEIQIPASMVGKQGRIFMGRIVDADVVYINGKQVGSTAYQYPQRIYNIKSDILKAGKNLIVVRVQNNGGKGGFVPDKPYFIAVGDEKIDLKGYWDYKVGQINKPTRFTGKKGPVNAQNQPTALYNAMIAPVTNYSIKGVLWYQGESNTGNASDYEKYLPALIQDWRNKFSNPSLPFYYVQLPGFGDYNYLPSESGSAIIREATLKTLAVPNTAMAVTIDLGEWNDIHPDRKKEVGDRLALIARHFNYGEKQLEYSGPLYQSAEVNGNKIIVNFTHTAGGLIAIDGEELSSFAIAGADKKFVWAKAKIVGNTVEVFSDEIPEPKYVRYAWADSPVNPNLYNTEKLPASPFRTDGQ